MSELIIPGQTIGIIGGDHIARLLTIAAKGIGFRVGILDPDLECVAADVADWQIEASSSDMTAMLKLANQTDVITFGGDPIDISVLQQLNDILKMPQTLELIDICQNRFLERELLEASTINIVPYARIYQVGDIEAQVDGIGFPALLKTANPKQGKIVHHVMESLADIRGCFALLQEGPCLLEAMIPFEKEIVVMIVGNGQDEPVIYPYAEALYSQERELQGYQMPSALAPEITAEVNRIANEIAITFNLQGILTISLLLDENGILYVNSLDAQPHNAGHGTLETSNLSQFEAHLRGICGWKLPKLESYSSALIMNVGSSQVVEALSQIPFQSNWYHHYYGESIIKPVELAGHITILTDDLTSELEHVKETYIWKL